jgi:uncharacterized protein (DUF885 family)
MQGDADVVQLSQLERLLEGEWDSRVRDDPLFATRCGDHRCGGRLPAVSEKGFQRCLTQTRGLLDRLREIDRSSLMPEAQLNYDILGREMRERIAEYELGAYLMPVTKISSFQRDFPDRGDQNTRVQDVRRANAWPAI